MTWRQRWRRWTRPAWLGAFGRAKPLSPNWGYDRGTPVDRYYIERFLAAHRQDIRGRVLEVKDSGYTTRFGNDVERSDVLDVDRANVSATIVADLASADAIPSASFDCFILTQTLPLIYDLHAAVRHAHRLLAPGGVLLATVPSITPMLTADSINADYWRLTGPACQRLFGDIFGSANTEVRTEGGLAACLGFLQGLAAEDLSAHELAAHELCFPLLVTIRARRGATGQDREA